MSYEMLTGLCAFFAVETVLLLAALCWFVAVFDKRLKEQTIRYERQRSMLSSLMEQTITAQRREIEVVEQRSHTRVAFAAVTNSLHEGLNTLARKLRICRTIGPAKTKREKEIWRKARYQGQAEVMLLVARDWDREMDAGILESLDKETLESLPLNLETAENDNGESIPMKAAAK